MNTAYLRNLSIQLRGGECRIFFATTHQFVKLILMHFYPLQMRWIAATIHGEIV